MRSEEQLTEVRFSEFNPMLHSFCLNEVPVREIAFIRGMALKGPLVAATDGKESYQLAYEHGSRYPDAFVLFLIRRKKNLCARREGQLSQRNALDRRRL